MRLIGRPFALLVGVAFLAASLSAEAAGKGIPWQSSLKKAQSQAAKQKKLVMVDFSAPW